MNSSPYPLGIRQEVMGLNCSSGGFGLDRRKTFSEDGKNTTGIDSLDLGPLQAFKSRMEEYLTGIISQGL